MKALQPDSSDPFRCYIGRTVMFEQLPHRVEGSEVHGHNLMFRLRDASDREARVTLLELLELVEQQAA